jgi:starch synthase (maltosyl-transferring)
VNPSPIDILYVITDLEIGGVPLHLYRLASAMKASGLRVAVVSLYPSGPVGERLHDAGIEVFSCHGRGGWDARVIWRLADLLRRLRPGLMHSLLFHANQAARFAGVLARFPHQAILSEIQTVEVERRWHLWIDHLTHPMCRMTIGNSPSVIAHLEVEAGIPITRLQLVRGGIEPSEINAATASFPAALGIHDGDDESPILLWAGRLDPIKGLHHLLEAMRIVVPRTGATLLLAGDGAERPRLESQAARLGLAASVRFLGVRQDVPSLMKMADGFVFPSRTEGLPNALLEAMAAGCGIVATDVAGCRDLISDGVNGLLVPYGDAAGLARAICQLLSHREWARELGLRAQKSVSEQWTRQMMLQGYRVIYESVLQSRPPSEPRP